MAAYIARQPILDSKNKTVAYELLYRNGAENKFNGDLDGNMATKRLVHNIMINFGLENITNGKKAFINFTRDLLFSPLPQLLEPSKVTIELLESIKYNKKVIERIQRLKSEGFIFALDDYTGEDIPAEVMDCVDIIKVDFMLTDIKSAESIAKEYRHRKVLLAEKVETEKEVRLAKEMGYTLFQGYYFSKPVIHTSETYDISSSTYMRLWRYISCPSPDFDTLAHIVETDSNAAYQLICKINTIKYITKNRIKSVKNSLIFLGTDEIKKWIMLILLKDMSDNSNDEKIRQSYVRAVFAEKTVNAIGMGEYSQPAYMAGLFSMMDHISKETINGILAKDASYKETAKALRGEDSPINEILLLITDYEEGCADGIEAFEKSHGMNDGDVTLLYIEAVKDADNTFCG